MKHFVKFVFKKTDYWKERQTQLLELECDASKVCGLTYTIKDTQGLSLPQPEFLIANITDFIRRLGLSGIVVS
jgi:hypothetical protein